MFKIIMATLLFLYTNTTLADVRNREKAKFDLISSIEVLVNIDECRKGLKNASILPRACNSLPYLSKYFFDPLRDRTAIDDYLNTEEAKITEDALKISKIYNINKLGKMTLSTKCVKNKDPLDLDVYLNRIKGITFPGEHIREDVIGVKPDTEPRGPAYDFK